MKSVMEELKSTDLFKENKSIPVRQADSLEELRSKQEPGAEFVWNPINPEYAKKLWEDKKVTFDLETVRKEFVSYVRLYESNYRVKWDFDHTSKENYRTIVKVLYEQLLYLTEQLSICPKSLMLIGQSGKGKTTIMKEFYRSVIVQIYRKLIPYFSASDMNGQHATYLHDKIIFIDDLGLELLKNKDEKGNFISKSDIAFSTFSMLDRRRKNDQITNITTNATLNDLIEMYGERSKWRMSEQFEVIEL